MRSTGRSRSHFHLATTLVLQRQCHDVSPCEALSLEESLINGAEHIKQTLLRMTLKTSEPNVAPAY